MSENQLVLWDRAQPFVKPSELDSSSDYTGIELLNETISGKECVESIFNGSFFEFCKIENTIFRSAEFTEARFVSCSFYNVSFDRSDFVLFEGNDCEFYNCTFNNGEWRDVHLISCKFANCDFRNTTISLCTFEDCLFDSASTEKIIGQSKRYNIFIACEFAPFSTYPGIAGFISVNFGFTAGNSEVSYDGNDPLIRFSFFESQNVVNTEAAISDFTNCLFELASISNRNRQVRARYLSKIVEKKCERGDFPVFAIQKLIDTTRQILPEIRDQTIALEFVSLAFKLKLKLIEQIKTIESSIESLQIPASVTSIDKFVLIVDLQFSEPEIKRLVLNTVTYSGVASDDVRFYRYATGSTIIEFALVCSIQTAAVITAFSYVMKKLKVLFVETGEVVDAGRLLIEKFKGKPTKGVIHSKKETNSRKKNAASQSYNYLLQENPEEQHKLNAEILKIQSHISHFGNKSMIDADGEIRLHVSQKPHVSSAPKDLS